MNYTASPFAAAMSGKTPPPIVSNIQPQPRSQESDAVVGEHRQELTACERAAAVCQCDRLIARYDAVWESDGCFAAKGNADRVRAIRERLMKGQP